ncbi:Uncharacterised protein [Nocardia africana]|uniref:TrbL/VirB6 plasmid conjugal transfer protein n=2 Tax=Nocardia africana TaxID=134964 RepID=A0A379X6J8_9NOCA|nr:Uncharacterised protein [Nocardia africana]
MVSTGTAVLRAVAHRGRLLLIAMTVVAAVFGPAAVASAQPADSGGGTYGFNDTCEEIHDDLDNVGIPGTPFNLGNAVGGACKAGNAATHPGDAAQAVKDKAWDSTFGKVVDSLLNGLGQAVSLGLTFWAKVPNSAVDDLDGLIAKVRDYTSDIQIIILAFSLMWCGVRLAAARRNAAASEAVDAYRVLLRTVIISGGWSTVLVLGTHASDAFASWVIDDATGGNAKGIAEAMIETQALSAFSPGLVLIFAIVGLLSALLQIVLAIVRQGLLCVVAGILPLAASASGAGPGNNFSKSC